MTKLELGKLGEKIAQTYLANIGHKIIKTNYRSGRLEIDIISKYKNLIVFTEVKTRIKTAESIQENPLGLPQATNIKKAISSYIFKNKLNLDLTRLDLIIVLVNITGSQTDIVHYQDIF